MELSLMLAFAVILGISLVVMGAFLWQVTDVIWTIRVQTKLRGLIRLAKADPRMGLMIGLIAQQLRRPEVSPFVFVQLENLVEPLMRDFSENELDIIREGLEPQDEGTIRLARWLLSD